MPSTRRLSSAVCKNYGDLLQNVGSSVGSSRGVERELKKFERILTAHESFFDENGLLAVPESSLECLKRDLYEAKISVDEIIGSSAVWCYVKLQTPRGRLKKVRINVDESVTRCMNVAAMKQNRDAANWRRRMRAFGRTVFKLTVCGAAAAAPF